MVRTPLLPANAFLEEMAPAGTYEARREVAVRRMRELVARPDVRDALYVASPGLLNRLDAWLQKPEPGTVDLAVTRYLERMSLRCTPFGLFAGVSVAAVGLDTALRLGPATEYVRHTRLDTGYLTEFIERIAADPAVRAELLFQPNSSLYRAGRRLHYFEARQGPKGRGYFLVAVDEDETLREMLDQARDGVRLGLLVDALVSDEISTEDAEAYVDELVEAQLLVPQLGPTVTGSHALNDVIDQLKAVPATADVSRELKSIVHALARLDTAGVGVATDQSLAIQARLKELQPKADPGRLLQVDLTKPSRKLQLDEAVIDDIQRSFGVLHDLFAAQVTDRLDSFRRQFQSRYGDAELPLVEVLDEEVGIGFRAAQGPVGEAAPLLAGLHLAAPTADPSVSRNAVDRFLMRKLCEALNSGAVEIEVTDAEVASVRDQQTGKRLPLPDAYGVMACVWTSVDGHEVAIQGGGGPSGARLLARFCPLDAQLDQHVKEHLRAEEALQPAKRFFEIVHLPEGRMGNVLGRTVLRDYELTFLGRSGVEPERQLNINDLLISMRDDRIVLRSRRLNCEVEPRLSSAHNAAHRSTGVYRFLVELQQQGVITGLRWSWGTLDEAPMLPRVRYGRTVLSPQRWNIRLEELDSFRNHDPEPFYEAFRGWASKRGLPRHFTLVESDRMLPIDVENPLSVEAFWDLACKRSTFTLEECVPPLDRCAATGPEGPFVHELVVPFVRRTPLTSAAKGRPVETSNARRPIGSDWLYAKIFCGKAAADRVLTDHVAPLQRALTARGLTDRWFFIRYADPQPHLRLRMHGNPESLTREAYPLLVEALSSLQADRTVWLFQLDAYDQELVRYGGEQAMPLCEEIFAADSEAVIECLRLLRGDEHADTRWKTTLRGMDALLEDFGLDPLLKYALADRLSAGFRREFLHERLVKKQVSKRFRQERAQVESALSNNGSIPQDIERSLPLFEQRSRRIQPAVAALKDLEARGVLITPMPDIAASMLHMHANRMLRAAARAQEMVLYSMLAEHHDSQLARRGIKGKERERQLKALDQS